MAPTHHVRKHQIGNELYTGNLKGVVKQGYGSSLFAKTDNQNEIVKFSGLWNDNRAIRGSVEYISGARYVGDIHQGHFHGRGAYHWANGNTYSGEWYRSKMHGKGAFRWYDGSYYKGRFINDMIHGQGRFTTEEGNSFKTFWENGLPRDRDLYSSAISERCTKDRFVAKDDYCGETMYVCSSCHQMVCRTCIVKHLGCAVDKHRLTAVWATLGCGSSF